ncbi:WbqC family protein [Primorskyibacter sp. S187A]|uniref:WbqC family protein n=1 Tax=Primorskyibacter sp. S187A TaxID=3415130 RepID=UPI003C79DD39
MTSVAVMQPYVFPYLGYFQLIAAVDHFVAYDDVNFIKRGWINRNRISNRGQDALFTVPVQGGSQNVPIREVITALDDKWLRKFTTQLEHEYKRAPYFAPVRDLVLGIFEEAAGQPVSELAVASMAAVMGYLELPFTRLMSSERFAETASLKRADRLIAITRALDAAQYVNLPGGVALYGTQEFAAQGIDLRFICERSVPYAQFDHPFLPHLSIIDVLMHNTPAAVREMLGQYDLKTAEDMATGGAPHD